MTDGDDVAGPAFGTPAPETIRILHVDDDTAILDLAAELLARESEAFEVVTTESAAEGLSIVESGRVDCVVSDYEMPGSDGLEFLESVRERDPNLPFLLFTGKGSEEIASEAISAGVTDYLQKGAGTDQYAVLANRIEGYVDRMRATEALSESRRRLSRLIGNLPGMVYRCANEPGWPMEFVSEGAEEMTGHPPEAFHSGAVSWGEDLIHPEDREEMWETVQSALDAREPFEVTYRIVTASGEERRLWEQGAGVFDTGGEVEALEGFITDVTERESLESERLELAERLQAVVESSPEPIVALDDDEHVTVWNEAAEETFGWSAEEVVGEPYPAVPDDETEQFERIVDAVAAGGRFSGREVIRETKSGERIPVHLSNAPVEGPDGEVIGSMAVLKDVSDRRQLEAELRETAQRLETVIEASPEPIVALDTEGTVVLWNEAAEQTFGWSAEEVVGEPYPAVPPEERDQHEEMVDRVEAGEPASDVEIVRRTKDGERLTMRISSGQIRDTEGEVVGTMGVMTDLTELREREREADFFRQLVEKVGVGVGVYDESGEFVYVNDHMGELARVETASMVGEPIWTYNRGFDPELMDTYWDGIEPGETRTHEVELTRPDGEVVPVETLITRGDIQGTSYHFGTVRDISRRLALDAELRETADRLEAVIEASPEAIVAVDAGGEVTLWNAAAGAVFGHEPEAAVGSPVSILPEAVAGVVRDQQTAVADGRPSGGGEISFEDAGGEQVDVSISTAPLSGFGDDSGSGPSGVMAVIADVTERKEHERTVTRLHEATRDLMAAESPDDIADRMIETTTSVLGFPYAAVLLWDEEVDALRVVADTPEAREKTLSPPRVMQRGEGVSGTVFDTGEPAIIPDRLDSEWTIVQEDTGLRSACILPLGEHGVYVISSDEPHVFDERDVDIASLMATNAEAALDRAGREAELRRRERELARQNERLERFASVLSHDLRNPLNVAMGRLDTMDDPGPAHRSIADAVDRIAAIVEDVLAIARQGRIVEDPRPVELATVAEDAWATVDAASGTWANELDRQVVGDPARIRRLLENLLRNAVDHGGDDVSVRVGTTAAGFFVEDDGPGIPAGERERVFEFGRTTSDSGTGLGLAIAKEIADAHGWSIVAREAETGGARIEVTGVEWVEG